MIHKAETTISIAPVNIAYKVAGAALGTTFTLYQVANAGLIGSFALELI